MYYVKIIVERLPKEKKTRHVVVNNVTYSLSFFRLRFCKKIEWLLLCNESVEDFIVFRIAKRLCVGIPSERTNYCQQISRDIFVLRVKTQMKAVRELL